MTRWNALYRQQMSGFAAGHWGPHHAMRAVDFTPEPDHASSSLAFADLLEECRASMSESLELVRSAYRERSAPGRSTSSAIRVSRN
jgi:hypothetical protein